MPISVITVDDFKGGRTNFLDQVIIPPNVCASGSKNIWAPEGGLIKAPGLVLQSSFTASGTSPMPHFWVDDTVSTANKLFYRISLSATGGGVGTKYFPFGSGTNFTDAITPLGYVTGSVSISGANLISATGNGTSWTANVTAGDRFQPANALSGWYPVSSVEDDTHLTLTSAVPAAVATGSAYKIQPGLTFLEIACASLNGSLVWSTTGDYMQRYDGTNISRMSAPPQVAYLATHKNYMFGLRSGANPSRLYWSNIKDPTTWGANNFIDIDALNNQGTGLFSYGQELIVFKTRSMYKIIGDTFDPSNPTYYVLRISTPGDFIFNNSYTCGVHKGILTFYGGGRIYQYRMGTNFITDISPNIIRDLPTSFGSLIDSMATIEQRVNAIVYNDYYILKGLQDPNNGSLPMALILDRNLAWWYLSNTNASTSIDPFDTGRMAIVQSASSRPQLIVGMGSSFGKLFSWDFIGPSFGTTYPDTSAAGVTSTTAIEGIWKSKEFNIDYGIFKWIVLYFQKQNAGNLTVQWSIDQGTAISYTQSMTTGRGQIIRAVIPVNQKGSTIQLTLSNNTVSQTFKIYAVKIFYESSSLERLL